VARRLSGYPGALDLRYCLTVIARGNSPVESTIPEQRAQDNKQGDYSHSHQKLVHEFPPRFFANCPGKSRLPKPSPAVAGYRRTCRWPAPVLPRLGDLSAPETGCGIRAHVGTGFVIDPPPRGGG